MQAGFGLAVFARGLRRELESWRREVWQRGLCCCCRFMACSFGLQPHSTNVSESHHTGLPLWVGGQAEQAINSLVKVACVAVQDPCPCTRLGPALQRIGWGGRAWKDVFRVGGMCCSAGPMRMYARVLHCSAPVQGPTGFDGRACKGMQGH
jgi:hypothetical protein